MENIKISVIVPVYNAESYLEVCLNSLLSQTFQNYDVWLIDDGSTDQSGTICDKFVEKNSCFHVIHKPNGGVSSARNVGLDHALGEWICFVDSDDTVGENYLENLYKAVHKDCKELLVVQGFSFVESGKKSCERTFAGRLYDANQMYLVFQELNLNRSGFPFGKLYNNTILRQQRIRFNENIHYAEDVMFMLAYMCHITAVQTVSGSNYNYYKRSNTLSTRIYSFESEYTCYQTYVSNIQKLKERFSIPEEALLKVYGVISEYLVRRSIGSMYQVKTRKSKNERLSVLRSLTQEQIVFLNRYYKQCSWFHKVTTCLLTKHCYYLCDMFNLLIAIGRSLKEWKSAHH